MSRYRALLRRRNFALLWTGATVSAVGDGMSFLALVWLVLERGGGAADVGWMAAVYTGPVAIGGLLAGLALDRFDRRRLLIWDNLLRGLAVASIPIAAAAGVLTTLQIFVVAAVYGLLFMTSLAGIPSLIPALVAEDELTTANAMESLSFGIAGLVGPALAGVVIATFGATAVLAVDALTYGAFVVCLMLMRPIETPAPSSVPAGAVAGTGIGPAIRFVLRTPAILAITLIYMAVNVGEGIFLVLAPIYATTVLAGDSATYGALVTALTAGALLGSLLVGAIDWRWPLGRSIAVATVGTGVAMGLLSLLPSLVPALLILFLAGLCASSLTAWGQTIRMRLIPAEMRGRVFALLRTLMQSTPPIGAAAGGFLLARGDILPAIATMAALMIVPGLVALVLPAMGPIQTAEPGLEAQSIRSGVNGRTS